MAKWKDGISTRSFAETISYSIRSLRNSQPSRLSPIFLSFLLLAHHSGKPQTIAATLPLGNSEVDYGNIFTGNTGARFRSQINTSFSKHHQRNCCKAQYMHISLSKVHFWSYARFEECGVCVWVSTHPAQNSSHSDDAKVCMHRTDICSCSQNAHYEITRPTQNWMKSTKKKTAKSR